MKIYHAADIHLGRRRLDGRLPDSDLANAFEAIVKAAIEDRADVFVLAGDLFDRPQVEPPNLRQAQRILALLKSARIPVVAIEGNHDKTFVSSTAPTWVDYLAQEDLLHLLKPAFDSAGAVLTPWDGERRAGSWIDLHGVRFVGAGYLGAATPSKVRQIAERLEPADHNVLLLHAGPDYFVGEGGGFAQADLAALREKVRYLALGHIHKPMLYGGWACNPGSPENCELREAQYDRTAAGEVNPRGYAVIELDLHDHSKAPVIDIRSNPRRPCIHLDLDCTSFGNKRKDGAAALEKAALKLIKSAKPSDDAVVELRLAGRINLDRIALDLESLGTSIEAAAGVAAVFINPVGINLEAMAARASSDGDGFSREEIERAALRQLVEGDHLWGLDGEQQAAASLFYELKEAIRTGRAVQELAELIRVSPLVEKVRLARATAALAPVEPSQPANVEV